MSDFVNPLEIVKVEPNLVKINNNNDFGFIQAGENTQYQPYPTTNISGNSITFVVQPSPDWIIDREFLVQIPVRITGTCTNVSTTNMLVSGCYALRAYPINGSLNSVDGALNSEAITTQPYLQVHAFSRFNNNYHTQDTANSYFPSALDQSADYSMLFETNRSPLMYYGDNVCPTSRASFPLYIQYNTPTTFCIDTVICEPLYSLAPYLWGNMKGHGLYNVKDIKLTLTFLSGNACGSRMLCIDNVSNGGVITNINTTVTFNNFASPPFAYTANLSTPSLLLMTTKPQSLMVINPERLFRYPYFNIYPQYQLYSPVTAHTSATFATTGVNLPSIPKLIYIFIKDSDTELQNDPFKPDCYFSIEALSIQYNNQTYLASATKRQLFLISRRNACDLSWESWSGDGMQTPNVASGGSAVAPLTSNNLQWGVGSVLCICPAIDFGLNCLQAEGSNTANFPFSINNLVVRNNSNRTITPQVTQLFVFDGMLEINRQIITKKTNFLTKSDVLNADQLDGVTLSDVEEVRGSGNFFSKIGDKLKEHKVLSRVASIIPHPIAKAVGETAAQYGYGEDGMGYNGMGYNGMGVAVGGKYLDKKNLMRHIKNY